MNISVKKQRLKKLKLDTKRHVIERHDLLDEKALHLYNFTEFLPNFCTHTIYTRKIFIFETM